MPASGPSPSPRHAPLAGAVVVALLLLLATAALGTRSVVVRFPAAGACHVRGSGLYVLPDPRCTPGATDPVVTSGTLRRTICARGWTETVRPPESVTEAQKGPAIAAYGAYAGRRLRSYELDHLIPLELGGAPDAAANLWPEPDYGSVVAGHRSYYLNPKDRLEGRLHQLVCAGRLSLVTAQRAIASDWVAARARFG